MDQGDPLVHSLVLPLVGLCRQFLGRGWGCRRGGDESLDDFEEER